MKHPIPLATCCLLLSLVLPGSARAAEPDWIAVSDSVIEKLTADGAKIGWPGQTAGVAVDRTTGDVFMVVCDQGLWKSTDQAKTFQRVDGGKLGGRCETGFGLQLDPRGKQMAAFMIYGGSGLSADGGKTWTGMKVSHWDFGAVDWETGGKCLLAFEHHKDGTLGYSTDAGQTWNKTDYQFIRAVGVFDPQTLIIAKQEGIHRSTDAGKTWTQVSKRTPNGNVMQLWNGVGYLASEQGVLVTRDKGATWEVLGAPVKAWWGPYFGADAKQLVVVGPDGIQQTLDGGESWKRVAKIPQQIGLGGQAKTGFRVGPNFAWDYKHNLYYASAMGKPTLQLRVARGE